MDKSELLKRINHIHILADVLAMDYEDMEDEEDAGQHRHLAGDIEDLLLELEIEDRKLEIKDLVCDEDKAHNETRKKYQCRPQRGGLAESMAEAHEFDTLDEVKEFFVNEFFGRILFEYISIGEESIDDHCIGWHNTHYVLAPDRALNIPSEPPKFVVGMVNIRGGSDGKI
ncbi:hypothetical protein FACS189450_03320 [Spirochaetia bacterium]|nr:hypothetical protein FACS189450_03320 [Spirochaetia bacterium]